MPTRSIHLSIYQKSNKTMCAAAQMQELIANYSENNDLSFLERSLPDDKYEKAAAIPNYILDSSTHNEKFQEDFFHGEL